MKPFIFFLVLFPGILFSSLFLVGFQQSWYAEQPATRLAYQQLGQERVVEQTENLLQFLVGQSRLQPEFYTLKELAHLIDVRRLLLVAQIWTTLSMFALLSLSVRFAAQFGLSRYLYDISLASAGCSLAYVLLALLFWLDFDTLFLNFHHWIFANDFWLLDPQTKRLLVIFDTSFFFSLPLRLFPLSINFTQ